MPDALRADVRVLGEALGQVLREYGGQGLLDDVERLRELVIASHHEDLTVGDDAAVQAERLVASWSMERCEEVARAFTAYFHLVNTAEEYHRIRALRAGDRGDDSLPGALAQTINELSDTAGMDEVNTLLSALEFRPVLTAHPTEARRRAVVNAIRRVAELLPRRDDPRLGESESAETHRLIVENVDVLWRTAPLRAERPGPLDEVRTAMTAFDDVLFHVVPQVYRRADTALGGGDSEMRAPQVPAFVRLGSWIGGDRDGNPYVTSAITRQAMAIQSDHVLAALENACATVGRSMTLDAATTPPSPEISRMLGDAEAAQPELYQDLATRSPNEPHRIALLYVSARVAATRRRDADLAYEDADEMLDELRTIQASLVQAGALRQAYGELQSLVWQVESFGFHLAELEIRQHSAVHEAALEEIRAGGELSERTQEVLATIRVMAQIQARFGPQACRRYIVSFTRSAADIAAVHELARYALDGRPIELDVVPLFETGADLDAAVDVLEETLDLPEIQERLDATDRRFEVMLGYSDSAKDVGPVSATLKLYEAQAKLTEWAALHKITLTMFHGRGGALGRGGGPANRAVLAQAPGSVDGRFKLTEQGEVIFARYGNPAIARRHVEQVSSAVLLASTPEVEERASAAAVEFAELARTLDAAAQEAYHALVRTEGFAAWFARVTPLEEVGSLPLGSRPARRGLAVSSLEDLRAIPWVFSWAQTRVNLPGWYGLGSGLAAVADIDLLRRAREEWPLFTVMLENVEMSLAKTDRRIASRYLELGDRPELTEMIMAEHELATEWVLKVTGHSRLLEDRRVLGRAVALRNPYVDALSYLQVRALRTLRTGDDAGAADEAASRRLLQISVNGVAAGLQNTG
ncbi:phosphoenolpyruvate carboxylase [Actinobacteria bacterium YIM 96077]|uniref:Phosphoenolpyruvate carboxylase n=1 Tax=Phytoactinopolyspora halophila TaxID=1981511 RepID=A0A329QHK5_9ACTN|nr:phosphoenolpyruvate carboxylase [Phytoactinopolyspora halophila]AYY14402.1 phosphoenolpyruvate carboxylase [Actinobacteria bacterium YIM 96077]RAW11877.1 phosphoenolpyruvate carboxylase [Phytoactinopolyspora halophila]